MVRHRVIADRYELTAPIGRGGMGMVFRGYDRRLDRRIAVKLMSKRALNAGDTDADILVERFLRETRMTARVEHPGVPAVYDAGTDGDDLFLVLQLVDGRELGGYLAERGPLPVIDAAAIGAQLASVLAAAHACFLVHRDLKPANVMIRPDGTVTLLDFGIAVLLDPSIPRLTRDHTALGTTWYMAPEQWRGEDVTARTDLYALGCLLFELLTGRPPFTADHPAACMHQHLTAAPPAPSEVGGQVPGPLTALIADLLAKSPADRPASADDVLSRLAPYLPTPRPPGATDDDGGDNGSGHDPTRPYRHPFASARHRGAPPGPAEVPAAPGGPGGTGENTARPDPEEVREEVARLVQEQRFTQAGDVLSDALRHADGFPGEVRLRFAHMRADAWFNARRVDEAEQEYRRLLPLVIEYYGEGSEDVLDCRDGLAGCLIDLDRHGEAVEVMLDLLDDYRALGREDEEDALELRYGIARSQAAAGDRAGARDRLGELCDDVRRVLGPDHPLAMQAAGALRRLG